jgi:hypothetical protein
MFWQILSGIAAVSGNPGTGRKPTRFSFRFLALLIAACWVLLGIWAFSIPEGMGGYRFLRSPESPRSRMTFPSCPARIRHRQPVREKTPG